MHQKNVVMLSTFFHPFTSGAEMCAQELARHIHERDTYSLTVVTARLSRTIPREDVYYGVRVIRVGVGHATLDKFLFPFLAVFTTWRLKPSLVHAIMESYAGIALMLYTLLFPRTRTLLTLQSGDLDEKAGKGFPVWLWRMMHRVPDQVTAISHALYDRAVNLGSKKVSLIYNGVHSAELRAIAARTPLFHDGRIHIGCIARLSPEKGVEELVAAMALVADVTDQVVVHCIGDGVLRSTLEALIAKHQLQHTVILHGRLPHEETMSIMAACHYAIVPSRAEGLGIVAIEALCLGKGVIATNVGGLPDVVTPDVGVLVEPRNPRALADAIISVARGELLTEVTVECAQRRAQMFEWDAIFTQYDTVYQMLLAPRLVFATGIYPPEKGGPATYVPIIDKVLQNHNWDTHVVTYGSVETIRDDHVTVIERSNVLSNYVRYCRAVYAYARCADLVYVQDMGSAGLPAMIACTVARTPYVLKVVGEQAWERAQRRGLTTDSLDAFQNKQYDFVTEMIRVVGHSVASQARLVITPSVYLKTIVMKWGVSAQKVQVVYNGVAVARHREDIPDFPEGDVILVVARLVPWKQIDRIMHALTLVHEHYPDVRLCIVGDGPEEKNLKQLVREKGLAGAVLFMGSLSHGQVRFCMEHARMMVNDSQYEGLSHSIVEAFHAGLPVIASRAGGNPELVIDGVTGLLVDSQDDDGLAGAIMTVLNHPEYATKLATAAKRNLEQFTDSTMQAETYKHLAQQV